jgi:hypothetical protein
VDGSGSSLSNSDLRVSSTDPETHTGAWQTFTAPIDFAHRAVTLISAGERRRLSNHRFPVI